MNYTFIITSTINTMFGVFDRKTRYEQTLETIKSIRDKVPGAKIVLVDTSTEQFLEEWFFTLREKCDLFLTLYNHYAVQEYSSKGRKSPGETYALMVAMTAIKEMNMVGDRVFKISGRYKLSESFDITEYEKEELKGKYVFKKSVLSWMPGPWSLVDTRLWSFCGSLIDEIPVLLSQIMSTVLKGIFDAEHAYYTHLDKSKLVEFPIIHAEGYIASTGFYQYD